MTVLSRSKKAAVRTGLTGGVPLCGTVDPPAAGSDAVTVPSIGAGAWQEPTECTNWQFTTGAGDCNLSCYRVLSLASSTCAHPPCRVYSEHYSAYAGCASARPPGADTRRPPPPPPLAGVVPFGGFFSHYGYFGTSRVVAERDFQRDFHWGRTAPFVTFVPRFPFIRRRRSDDGVVSSPGRSLRS